MFIRAYTCIYIHLRSYTYIYMHIRTYTYIFKHHQIAVGRCFGGEAADVFWQQYEISPTRSAVIGHETGSQCSDMARGTAQQSWGDAKGALDACGGEGAQNRVCKSVAYDGKKCMPRCPGVP